jgi:hypothetical protein
MALTALPLTDSFALAWEHDPALDRERENFDDEYRISVETLDWDRLCKPGEKPTLFHFRAMRGKTQRAVLDMNLGAGIGLALVFRLCLVRVENFNLAQAPEFKRERDASLPHLGDMVSEEFADYLDRLPLVINRPSGALVSSLGGHAWDRCLGIRPKS